MCTSYHLDYLLETGFSSNILHAILHKNAEKQVAQTVQLMINAGIGPYFYVVAHEMFIPPWMGMNMFDEFVVPYDKMVNDTIHRNGGLIRIHCHGNCMDYLKKMSEMGVDSIEPLEPPPFGNVDLAEAKKRVGDRMLLSGNIASQDFLQMTTDDVRQSVKNAISATAGGGGFTLRTTGGYAGTSAVKNETQLQKVLDNIEAYINAGLEFGEY